MFYIPGLKTRWEGRGRERGNFGPSVGIEQMRKHHLSLLFKQINVQNINHINVQVCVLTLVKTFNMLITQSYAFVLFFHLN